MKLVVFDLDDTLIDGSLCNRVLPESIMVLEFFKKRGIMMAIASDNSDARWFLKKNNLCKYFVSVEAFRADDKVPHIKRILESTGIHKNDCIFIDDCPENIRGSTLFGITSLLVNHKTGVTLLDVLGLDK